MNSWREYVNNLTEEGDIKNILQNAFEEAKYFIGSMSNYYGLQISIPNVFICSSLKINASVLDKKIIINEGLLSLLFFEDLKIDNNYLDDKKHIPKRMLLWIVAHE